MIANVVRSWWSRFTHSCPAPPLDETPLTADAPDPGDVGQQWTCDCGRAYVVDRSGWTEVPWERHAFGVEFKYWANRAPWAQS